MHSHNCCGIFLYTSLIPIQDFDLLTQAEKIAFQKETAINYPLGNIMFHGGIAGSVICSVLLKRKSRAHKKDAV